MPEGKDPREDCYNAPVIARDILAFVSRDWERVRRAKDHYWSERIARFGPAEAFRIGDDLRRQGVLRLVEEALGQSDLRPAFQRIRQS